MIRVLLGRFFPIIVFTESFTQRVVVPGMRMQWLERGPCGLVLLSVQPSQLCLDGARDLALMRLQARFVLLLRHTPLPGGLNACREGTTQHRARQAFVD